MIEKLISLHGGRPARPRPTALLPPRSNGKTRGCYCSCCSSWWWAWGRPKHGELHINVSNKLEKLLHLVGRFIWICKFTPHKYLSTCACERRKSSWRN